MLGGYIHVIFFPPKCVRPFHVYVAYVLDEWINMLSAMCFKLVATNMATGHLQQREVYVQA